MRLALVAGEASGDLLAADLAEALRQRHPGVELAGVAGPRMRQAGVEPWFEVEELSVMGLAEVVRHLPRLVRLRRALKRRILDWPAAAVVTIDAPDFNLGLARGLKAAGLPTIHYVSPSVWAWRAGRIPRIARSLDHLLTLFPFEPELYTPHGLAASFVGHPLADELAEGPDRDSARAALGLDGSAPVIALLPGSRDGELKRHTRLLGETARILRQSRPDARLLMLLTGDRHRGLAEQLLGGPDGTAGIRLVAGATRAGLEAADVAVAASGTVTLEAFLLECPLVVFYRLAPVTYHLARTLKLVRSRHVALPNILAGRDLVPELLQQAATPGQLAREALAWLDDGERAAAYRVQSRHWRVRLARGAGKHAAQAILAELGRA
ncbi:MAG: lipid-A-disaccharide synthase [Wenzhouxiangella sp.]|nr:MAG: lipid-A-disaccharide synthase [Wenzhouxiangella sp.]